MPPGEAYGSQGRQQQQHPQQHQFQVHPQVRQLHPQPQPLPSLHSGPQAPPLPQPSLLPHSQYANPYPSGHQQYQQQHRQHQYQNLHQQQQPQQQPLQHQHQHVQYVHPAYPQQQQPVPFYPSHTPQQPYRTYNGVFHQFTPAPAPAQAPPPALAPISNPAIAPRTTPLPHPTHTPMPMPAPVQFVEQSYVQHGPAARPSGAPLPVSQQPSAPLLSPQIPRPAQPKSPSQRAVKPSPKTEEKRPPSRGTPKLLTKEPRRPSSSAGVTKSPVAPQASTHVETLPLLLSVAEDCFEKANAAAQRLAKTMSPSEVAEHHKLIATGLGCLDVALKSNKLWPRLEARLCLRYTSILIEETNNITEAETALTRGISVCEKHRFLDLKYSSQFLLMKTLFQRNQKAAFKSIEGHIADCTTYKHVPWIYVFRFLKASFHLQSGTAADNHAIENLRKIAGISSQRNDKAIFVMAMLLEGLAHLSTMKDDWVTRVQMCIAQTSKFQLDESIRIPQTDVLLLMLDLACSLHQKNHQISAQKLSALQRRLEELKQTSDWSSQHGEMLLPINRMQNTQQIVSADTRAVLRPGDDKVDYLVISALGKQEAWALAFVLNGIVAHYKATTPGRSSESKTVASSYSLPEALKQAEWAKELSCYAHILTGLQAATLSDWTKVKTCLKAIKQQKPESELLGVLALYLEGVFYQGTAALDKATEIWKDKQFEMDWSGVPKPGRNHIATELSILAALNRLWIMQDPAQANDAETAELVDLLRPICEDNPDQEIRTVYNLVLSSIRTNPPLSINQIKRHIQQSLGGAQQTSNTQHLAIALNIMRARLFENVVGEQALKSARAGAAQARKSGNVLWMSVAEGMLAQSFEMQGALAEARTAHGNGVRLANEAFAKTQV
ncbi:hypothetical protein VTH82DRAFT_1978 [Thermothelomyces myriococcoides]